MICWNGLFADLLYILKRVHGVLPIRCVRFKQRRFTVVVECQQLILDALLCLIVTLGRLDQKGIADIVTEKHRK